MVSGPSPSGGRRSAWSISSTVEELAQRVRQRLLGLRRGVADEAVGGEDGQPLVLQRDQAHEHVAVLALAADLLGVDARGLVAVVAVGDEQLGRLQGAPGRPRSPRGRVTRPSRLTVPSSSVCSPNGSAALQDGGGGAGGVVVEAEDGGEVRLRRAGEPEPVLLGARVRALVRADAPGAVVLDAHAREDAVAGERAAVGAGVVLGQRPQRGLVVAHDGALLLPALEDRSPPRRRCPAPARPRAGRRARRCRASARPAVGAARGR